MSNETERQIWAILVGVSFYGPGKNDFLPGAVNDINLIENYLKENYGLKQENIIKLTASGEPTEHRTRPDEPENERPTYGNIRGALETVTQKAQPGDLVYFHYSGHGTRTGTKYPVLKGPEGLDEVLVPTDIGYGGSYLRDVEVSWFLDKMVKKGLVATVVLDSCFSGGAARGGLVVRTFKGSQHPVPSNDPHIPEETLSGFWKKKEVSRGVTAKNAWLLGEHKYELFAACQANEEAKELSIKDKVTNISNGYGAFTYWLVESLKSGGPSVTHGMLHNTILDHIQLDVKAQTPVFVGREGRRFLSNINEADQIVQTISTTRESYNDNSTVVLRAGHAHAVYSGSEYAVYPWTASDFSNPKTCIAKIVVTKVFDLKSEARILGGPIQDWPTGCQAVLLSSTQGIRIRLLDRLAEDTHLLDQFREGWPQYQKGVYPMVLVPENDKESVDYHIVVNDRREYELQDTACKSFAGLPSSSDPKTILASAAHLKRFNTIRSLVDSKKSSKLQGKFAFFRVADGGDTSGVTLSESITVRFENKTSYLLRFAVFDFGPSWGIDKVFPKNADYYSVDGGGYHEWEFSLGMPEELDKSADLLVAFVTTSPTSFRSFELPGIGSGSNCNISGGSVYDPNKLPEGVYPLVMAVEPRTWDTGKIMVHIVR